MRTILTIKDRVRVAYNKEVKEATITDVLDGGVITVIPFGVVPEDAPVVDKKAKKKENADTSTVATIPHAGTVPVEEAGTSTAVWYAFGRGEKVEVKGKSLHIVHDVVA